MIMVQRGTALVKGCGRHLIVHMCGQGALGFKFILDYTVRAAGADCFPDPGDLEQW